jgi:hypothetical protein
LISERDGRDFQHTGSNPVLTTLEELKVHIIDKKKNEILELQRKINWLNDDIDYVTSLKDVKEDRERKLNELDI